MGVDSDTGVATDELGRRILDTLRAEGGEAESTTLRDDLGGVDKNKFNYRVREHLKPAGAVETRQVETDANHLPPNEIILTDTGREFLELLEDEGELEQSVSERVDELERQVETLQRQNQELQEQNRDLRNALERSNAAGLGDELQALRNSIDQLQGRVRAIEQDPIIASDLSPAMVDTGLIVSNTCKVLLGEVLDEETVEQKRVELKEEYKQEGRLLSG